MKTTGQILQDARLARKVEVDEAARITKIRPQFIRFLEADDYSHLPGGTVARGFIRNYSQFLGLKPDHILAVFRRDFVENQLGQIVPRGMVEPVNKVTLWTPRTTILAGVVLIFLLFGSYLIYQYRLLTGPPYLAVTDPPSDIQVTQPTIEVSGKTDPEATLSVNGNLVALEKGGIFVFRLPLQTGPNQVAVTATAKSGKTTTITRVISLTTTP